MGVAFVPLLTVEPNDDRVTVLELVPSAPPREIGLAWHGDRYRSPATDAFVETARTVCSELDRRSPALAV